MTKISPQVFSDGYYTTMFEAGKSPCLAGNGTTISYVNRSKDTGKDLRAVSNRLIVISKKLYEKNSPEHAALKHEISKHSFNGYHYLRLNLQELQYRMRNLQPANCLLRLIERVINFFGKLFGCKEVSFAPAVSKKNFTDIHRKLDEFDKEVIAERRSRAEYSLKVLGDRRQDNLTTEDLQALEIGLRSSIEFQVGIKRFSILFDKNQSCFSLKLNFSDSDIPVSTTDIPVPKNVNGPTSESEQMYKATVVDKEDGQIHSLLYSTIRKNYGKSGYAIGPGKLFQTLILKPGRQYEILNDKGEPLRFKIIHKAKVESQKANA